MKSRSSTSSLALRASGDRQCEGLKSGHVSDQRSPYSFMFSAVLGGRAASICICTSTKLNLCASQRVCPCACVCLCVHAGAPSHRRYKDRWLGYPPLPCLSSTHAGILRRSLRVCSVGSVFLSVCAPRSAATGVGAAAPDGIRERSARL